MKAAMPNQNKSNYSFLLLFIHVSIRMYKFICLCVFVGTTNMHVCAYA